MQLFITKFIAIQSYLCFPFCLYKDAIKWRPSHVGWRPSLLEATKNKGHRYERRKDATRGTPGITSSKRTKTNVTRSCRSDAAISQEPTGGSHF